MIWSARSSLPPFTSIPEPGFICWYFEVYFDRYVMLSDKRLRILCSYWTAVVEAKAGSARPPPVDIHPQTIERIEEKITMTAATHGGPRRGMWG
jgi:hypothetical protein